MEKILNRINETLSIHRSVFICKDDYEVDDKMIYFSEHDFPCTDSCEQSEIERYRVIVLTFERFIKHLDVIPLSETTIIYTTCVDCLELLTQIMDEWKIKLLVTLVQNE